MAKEYKDQILDTSVNTKRVYNIVDSDGNIVAENISLEDKTVYSQEGTEFGAQEVNEIYEAIEELNQSLTLDFSNASEDVQDLKTFLQMALEKLFPKATEWNALKTSSNDWNISYSNTSTHAMTVKVNSGESIVFNSSVSSGNNNTIEAMYYTAIDTRGLSVFKVIGTATNTGWVHKVQISENGTDWIDVASTSSSGSIVGSYNISDIDSLYVRYHITTPSSGNDTTTFTTFGAFIE